MGDDAVDAVPLDLHKILEKLGNRVAAGIGQGDGEFLDFRVNGKVQLAANGFGRGGVGRFWFVGHEAGSLGNSDFHTPGIRNPQRVLCGIRFFANFRQVSVCLGLWLYIVLIKKFKYIIACL